MNGGKKNAVPPTENGHIQAYQPARFKFVYIGLLLIALMLIGKAFTLQVIGSKRLIEEANKRSLRSEKLPFTRGKILDRNGRILSMSVPLHSITIDPKLYFDTLLARDKERWKALGREMDGASPTVMREAVNAFIERKQPNGAGKKYQPQALFNIKTDDYWKLLAEVTNLNYQDLITKVRNNPHSTFLKLEYDAIRTQTEKLQALAKLLEMKYSELLDLLYKRSADRFAYISRHQSEQKATSASKLGIVGIVLKIEPRSFYPMAEESAQLIGYTNKEGYGRDPRPNIPASNRDNGSGLEYSFDQFLTGENGKRVLRKDRKGNVVDFISEEKQYNPQDVVLSIDEELQSMAYREIKKAVIDNKAESGTAVLVDIQTGEILAMANAPSFNPNDPQRKDFIGPAARNRAITDTFEPASTVKPFTILTALHHKVTYPSEIIDTRSLVVNGHSVSDVAKRDSLTLTGILQKSSNIGVAKLALRLPSISLLVDTYDKVGFGKSTGLGLGGESSGSNGKRSRWSDVERATLSYGYGLNVTPLQLARAYATLGSFGIYRPLSITKVDPPVIGERVLPEKVTREVVEMMESVAHKGEGGQHAAIDGYRVAIKTGTAKKLEKGKYVDKYIAYTAGVAPASNPRYSLVVIINEPKAGDYYGGRISAPLFSKIMGYTLKAHNVKPDNL